MGGGCEHYPLQSRGDKGQRQSSPNQEAINMRALETDNNGNVTAKLCPRKRQYGVLIPQAKWGPYLDTGSLQRQVKMRSVRQGGSPVWHYEMSYSSASVPYEGEIQKKTSSGKSPLKMGLRKRAAETAGGLWGSRPGRGPGASRPRTRFCLSHLLCGDLLQQPNKECSWQREKQKRPALINILKISKVPFLHYVRKQNKTGKINLKNNKDQANPNYVGWSLY